ncbi:hypothetical protein GCM10007392_03220 [Saccharospirillum salsuginis]|uniref:Uncharacterized protein n=1 Tax=Saccharospirillum salsuginis TaxID=418750 RepID=A0A918K1T4_9GAMM|nr:hypothetical protein GCM10007392_03220 [Saccharospirillum salsuginis]
MSLGFLLQVALVLIFLKLVSQCPVYLDWPGIVTFDKIGVVTIHCPNESGHRATDRVELRRGYLR